MKTKNQSDWCFSHNVRYLREKRGWTQEELAANSNVSVNEISKAERRLVIPRLNVVDRVSDAFGLSSGRMLDPYLDQKAEPPCTGNQIESLRAEWEELPEQEREFICRQARDTIRFFRERSRPRDPSAGWIFGGK